MTAPAQAPDVPRNKALVSVVLALAAAGALVGALWAWLAPPINGVIAMTRSGERVKAYLGAESDNWFTSAFLVVGMLSVLAVVAAVVVWQWKSHRGPAMAAALSIGSVAAATTAVGVGALLARLRYGTIDLAAAPVSEEQRVYYITEAPSVFFGHSAAQIAATLLFPAAVAATVYLLAAVASSRDDLGAWPPIDYQYPPIGRIETAADAPPAAPVPPSP